jgi:putative salt-induced outer membrane protein YdiY
VQDAKIDFGLGIGLYVAPIKFRISSTRSAAVEEASVTAPLPFLGVRLDYAITPKLFIKQSVDFFYMEYNQFKGRLLDAKIGIEYNIWKHFGLGLAYNFFYMDVESDGETVDWKGSINFGFSGLMLYGKLMF